MEPSTPLDQVLELHGRVDRRAAELADRHRERLQCRQGCAACCLDDLTVFEVEAARIRTHHQDLLREGIPHPEGACAFLDAEGACRVYEDRPFVCRTQGLPLRGYFEEVTGEIVEHRDICPLNEEGESLDSLADEDLWTLGEVELELAAIQRSTGEPDRRVRLRDLFLDRASPDGAPDDQRQ